MDKIYLIGQSDCPSLIQSKGFDNIYYFRRERSLPGPLVDIEFSNAKALSVVDNSIDAVGNNSCGLLAGGALVGGVGSGGRRVRLSFEDRILDLAMLGVRGTILIPDFTKLSR